MKFTGRFAEEFTCEFTACTGGLSAASGGHARAILARLRWRLRRVLLLDQEEGRGGGAAEREEGGGGRMTGGRTWQEALRNSCRLPKKAPFGRGQTARRGPGRPEEAGGLRRALWGFTHVTPPKIHPSGVSRTARGGSGLPWGPPGRARPNTRSGCSRALDGSI